MLNKINNKICGIKCIINEITIHSVPNLDNPITTNFLVKPNSILT
jgi:hypothetical protein